MRKPFFVALLLVAFAPLAQAAPGAVRKATNSASNAVLREALDVLVEYYSSLARGKGWTYVAR